MQRLKSKEGIARITLLGVVLAFFGNVLFVGAARADYGPSGYDPNTGKGDVVCVGSDTLQFLGNFLADGSFLGKAGFNAAGAKHDKLVSLDATGDAEARFSYAQTQTVSVLTPAPLDPTVILRAGSHRWFRRSTTGGSYLSGSDARVHFGLGAVSGVDRIEIRWPDGARQSVVAPVADRETRVKETAR